ncbi:UvrD-helicase domain-containing protein [Candidatus Peregrinibacteria bacterium]|nr:UvrD-helicase domain-containing protein [Candidatus Peregrinibacteria bacterium]
MDFHIKNYNIRQKLAITHENGPILVISGAGTGKTNLLIGRILYLILKKGVLPSEILALTFTEKATQEMIDRLDESLPFGYSEIWVKTFHSFCENVLRERGVEIGISSDFKILSEADLWMALKRNLAEFKLDYYKPKSNPYKFLNMLQQYFSRLQDEDILPEKYLKHAEKMKGEEREKHFELAQAYAAYQKLLVKASYMDFGGLLFNVLRLFETRKSVLEEYQNRFKYILVDEFQDTNFAQNKIVTLLAQKHKNLLVVGDDDQSIYKWRGASLTNIQYFEKLFPEAEKIVLNENYRSNQAILNLAYCVIQNNNPRRLEIQSNVDKKLISAVKRRQHMPEIYNFSTLEQEIDFVIEKAKFYIGRERNTAILVRTNALANSFVERIRRQAIYYQHFSQSDLFTKAGIKDCIALLRVICDPWDDMALFRFLSLPVWGIKMEDILKLLRQTKIGFRSLFDLLKGGNFERIKDMLGELIEFSRKHTVFEVLNKFLRDNDYLQEDVERMQDIALLAQCVREFENVHPEKTVREFLTYVQMLEESGSKNVIESAMDPAALKILTIHSAKGLEFDAVFVPGLVQGKFPTLSRREPFDVPKELIEEALPEGDHHLEEERRLFYVACTRARENLILSCSDFYDGKKQWKPSQFIVESLQRGKAVLKTQTKTAKTRPQKSQEGSQIELPFDAAEERKHRPIQKIDRISYSQIDTFKTCPSKYQFRYLFQIPAPTAANLNFGSSIHNTLRDFYMHIMADKKLAKEDLLSILKNIYEKNWIPFGYETREMTEDQKRAGFLMLKKYYLNEKDNLVIPEFLERQFMLKIGDLKLNGRIDRIDRLNDGTYEVIDYKTGSSKKDLKNDLQLTVYALACKEVFRLPVSKLSLHFLDDLKKVSTVRTEKDLEEAKVQILKYASEISSSDFSPTPGFHCGFCEFRLICPVAAPITR